MDCVELLERLEIAGTLIINFWNNMKKWSNVVPQNKLIIFDKIEKLNKYWKKFQDLQCQLNEQVKTDSRFQHCEYIRRNFEKEVPLCYQDAWNKLNEMISKIDANDDLSDNQDSEIHDDNKSVLSQEENKNVQSQEEIVSIISGENSKTKNRRKSIHTSLLTDDDISFETYDICNNDNNDKYTLQETDSSEFPEEIITLMKQLAFLRSCINYCMGSCGLQEFDFQSGVSAWLMTEFEKEKEKVFGKRSEQTE